ncbi:MAG: hypothetical protein K2P80_09990 [Beijerinckiaceae bacterium]|nr:hypothetical protein [Beijerinckiaceae bacterium]
MDNDVLDLDQLQEAYKSAVDAWIETIRHEESLVSANHTVAEVDKWEAAHFKEEAARAQVKSAKAAYEDALRAKFYNF